MADWATISSDAMAGGTLVLAVATFAAVRSSNQSARIAELALQEQRRPLATSACGRARSATGAIPLTMSSRARSPSTSRSRSSSCTRTAAQRTITRYTLIPIRRDDTDESLRLVSGGRHWYLDRAGPR